MDLQQLPLTAGGVVHRLVAFPSQHVAARHVDVWCPPDTGRRWPVVYMHDGQNLFEPAWSFAGVDWGLPAAMCRRGAGAAIVVGIWNTAIRRREYMPQTPLDEPAGQAVRERFCREQGGDSCSDAYLRFLVEELKPVVDAMFPTLPERTHTFVMGSSMGGLVSLYALAQYPGVVGGAGCVSTHWPIGGAVLVDYFARALPRPGGHRLYFDFGTTELDAGYEPLQARLDVRLAAAGWRRDVDWRTVKFAGAGHSEVAWRARVGEPLRFLLG